MTIGNMIKKELAVYHRVPGSSDQNTDLDITLLIVLSIRVMVLAHTIVWPIKKVVLFDFDTEIGIDSCMNIVHNLFLPTIPYL